MLARALVWGFHQPRCADESMPASSRQYFASVNVRRVNGPAASLRLSGLMHINSALRIDI